MIKKVLAGILLVCSLSATTACKKSVLMHRGVWQVVNHTEQDVGIRFVDDTYRENYIPKNLQTTTYDFIDLPEEIDFGAFLRHQEIWSDGDDPFFSVIFDGRIIKTWLFSEKNDSGRQYFDERFWAYREYETERYIIHEWTFELLADDLQ